ncbi:hypothetical protein WMY93_000033 [Mugilogobius chulae]|uniref:Uncharacterized protein n=1 Tax=Mugilogobius chulae TaxID=88201 RepID=A0AAW0Q8X4_9GOBI
MSAGAQKSGAKPGRMSNTDKIKASVKNCDNMKELKRLNIELLDTSDNLREQISTLTQKVCKLESQECKLRESERQLEKKCAEYECQIKTQNELAERLLENPTSDYEQSTLRDEASGGGHEHGDNPPEDIAQLHQMINSLRIQLRLSKSKEQEFEEERENWSAEKRGFQSLIDTCQGQVSQLSEFVNVARRADASKIEELEKELAEVKKTNDSLNEKVMVSKIKEVQFDSEKLRWRKERIELEMKSVKFISEIKDTGAQTDETMETLDCARKELKDVQEKCDTLLKSAESKDLKFNSEMKRRDEEQRQKENELQEARAEESKIAELEKELAESKETIDSLSEKLNNSKEAARPSKVKDTSAQTDETMDTLDCARQELEDVLEKFDKLLKSVESKESKFKSEMKRRDEEQIQKEKQHREALDK